MYSSKPVSDYGKIERLAHEHFKRLEKAIWGVV
jgi:hypothetical protein